MHFFIFFLRKEEGRIDIEKSCARPIVRRESGGWCGSSERVVHLVATQRAHHRHHGPSMCPPPPLPPLCMSDAIPRPLSPSLAGNFSFVHETAWSTAAYLMSLGSVVTRRRDAPILWAQMRHLRRMLSRKPQTQIVTHSLSDLTIANSRAGLLTLVSAFPREIPHLMHRPREKRVHVCNRKSCIVNRVYFALRARCIGRLCIGRVELNVPSNIKELRKRAKHASHSASDRSEKWRKREI